MGKDGSIHMRMYAYAHIRERWSVFGVYGAIIVMLLNNITYGPAKMRS